MRDIARATSEPEPYSLIGLGQPDMHTSSDIHMTDPDPPPIPELMSLAMPQRGQHKPNPRKRPEQGTRRSRAGERPPADIGIPDNKCLVLGRTSHWMREELVSKNGQYSKILIAGLWADGDHLRVFLRADDSLGLESPAPSISSFWERRTIYR